MEEFYQLLREYNKRFVNNRPDLPEWFFQYTEENPPLYWKTLYDILYNYSKDSIIVEIGAGYGDITALLYYMGYRNIISFEMDKICSIYICEKISSLFDIEPVVFNNKYPMEIGKVPDILIQVNCVYADSIRNKEEYLMQIKHFYAVNGIPKMYLMEVIDSEYKENNEVYPEYIRLNKNDIESVFPHCHIQSYRTYLFPQNKISKTLYKICIY